MKESSACGITAPSSKGVKHSCRSISCQYLGHPPAWQECLGSPCRQQSSRPPLQEVGPPSKFSFSELQQIFGVPSLSRFPAGTAVDQHHRLLSSHKPFVELQWVKIAGDSLQRIVDLPVLLLLHIIIVRAAEVKLVKVPRARAHDPRRGLWVRSHQGHRVQLWQEGVHVNVVQEATCWRVWGQCQPDTVVDLQANLAH